MTEQEFLEMVSLHCETYYKHIPKHSRDYADKKYGGLVLRAGKKLKDINLDDYILVKWVTGGQEGGNCWNNNHYAIMPHEEPSFDELDVILEQAAPDLSYLHYRKLIYSVTPKLIEYGSYTEHEYYGNYTVYGIKKVHLRTLWERLQGLGAIN